MANIVLNHALASWYELFDPIDGSTGAGAVIIPLSAADTDATIKDAGPDVTTVLGLAGTTEITTNNWTRKTIANGSLTFTIDDTNDEVRLEIPDQTWTNITTGGDTVAILVCTDGASDAVRYVMSKHDFSVTADGSDVVADFPTGAGSGVLNTS